MADGDAIAGRYRLDAEIGSGGMGEVWRATDLETGDVVALKRVRLSHLAPGERDRAGERLRAEAGIASRLEHPHIITARGQVEHDGEPWLVMEYVPAPNLADLAAGGLPPRRVAGIGAQVAEALAYAHGAGVLHRDVTPRNILVGADDHVTLTDFGISKIEGEDTLGTGGIPFAGVAAYVAPEVANGVKGGPKADVFSLGATLHAAVEGRSPWGDGDLVQTLAAAMKGVVEPPSRADALGPVLARMLQRRPRERPTAAAAAQLLAQVAQGRPIARRRWPWIAAAAVIAVVVALGVVLWPRPAPDTAVAAPGLGDPASADPCSLLRAEPFERFGEATLETDYGNFDRCDVIMESGADRFAVRVQFTQSPDELPEGVREERGGVMIIRSALVDEQCTRWLRLPDGHDVWIVARSERGAVPDLCAVADVATDTALPVLTAGGPVPRRQVPFDPASLALVDACGLLDPATVATVPGLETADPDRGFAGWECTWDTRTTEAAIDVRYDHDQGLEGKGAPARIAGRDAAVEPDGDGLECDVTILHRSYIDQFGYPYSELMVVEVSQPEPVADPCPQAVAIATVAIDRLPAAP